MRGKELRYIERIITLFCRTLDIFWPNLDQFPETFLYAFGIASAYLFVVLVAEDTRYDYLAGQMMSLVFLAIDSYQNCFILFGNSTLGFLWFAENSTHCFDGIKVKINLKTTIAHKFLDVNKEKIFYT